MNRILIAEDESRLASFIEKGFRKNGFATTIAEDGQKVLDLAINAEYELLLLDLGLPIKNGLTVLKELRAMGMNLPVIVVTAISDSQIKQDVLKFGANDYITKPFSFKDLLERVRSRLSEGIQS